MRLPSNFLQKDVKN